jgi:hypothetical protein
MCARRHHSDAEPISREEGREERRHWSYSCDTRRPGSCAGDLGFAVLPNPVNSLFTSSDTLNCRSTHWRSSHVFDFKLPPCFECEPRPMKMEQTECSETSEHEIQTSGNHPKERILHYLHEIRFFASWVYWWDLGSLVGSKPYIWNTGARERDD